MFSASCQPCGINGIETDALAQLAGSAKFKVKVAKIREEQQEQVLEVMKSLKSFEWAQRCFIKVKDVNL